MLAQPPPAPPEDRDPTRFRGFLDGGGPETGIDGWAADLSGRNGALLVELCAGDVVLTTARAESYREDVERLGLGVSRVGFHFASGEIRSRMLAFGVAGDARLWVRVAGTDVPLRSDKPVPPPAAFMEPAGVLPAEAVARDLRSALRTMAARAADLPRPPGAPAAEQKADGYIERLSWERDGLVWVFGWMKAHLPLHAPAIVADGAEHHPSAFVAATHHRADLPLGAHAIVGLMETTWRPDGRGGAPRLFLGDACLRFLERPKLFSPAECADWIEERKHALAGPFAKPLRRVFGSTANWVPDSARVTGAGVRAHVEGVAVLPGFGCLVEGWAVSPFRAVEGLMLKVGGSVLAAEARSIGREPRPDLLAAMPDAARLAEAGGFAAAFPGDVDEQDLGEVVLKVVCEGGLSTNHPVGAQAVRVLSGPARYDEVLRFFPAVREEPFFPELARRMAEGARRAASGPVGFEVHAAVGGAALVAAAPDDRSDMAMLFNELMLAARRRGRMPPVAVLARAGRHRAAVLSFFGDLRRNAAAPPSLFFVPDPGHAIHAVPEVLDRVGAARFAFVSPGVFPVEAGWDALLDRLEGHGEEEDAAAFLAVQDFAGGPPPAGADADAAPRAECFAWRRPAFAAWLEAAPAFLGGSSGQALTLPAGAVPALPGAAARRGRRAAPSVVATWVNEHLAPPRRRAEAPRDA